MEKPWLDAAIHLRKQGATLHQIAEQVGAHPSAVRDALLRNLTSEEYGALLRKRTSSKTDAIKEQLRLNKSPPVIAKEFGVSRQYVYAMRDRMREAQDKAIDNLGDKDYIDGKVGILQSQEQRDKTIEDILEIL